MFEPDVVLGVLEGLAVVLGNLGSDVVSGAGVAEHQGFGFVGGRPVPSDGGVEDPVPLS